MINNADEQFLKQFDDSRKTVEGWPQWMRESARVVTVTLPCVPEPQCVAPTKSIEDPSKDGLI